MHPREIKVPESKPPVRLLAMDVPQEGSSHQYRVERDDGSQVGYVNFHRGEIEINICDVNGVTPESLIAMLMDHIKSAEKYHQRQRDMAIKRLDEALRALKVGAESVSA